MKFEDNLSAKDIISRHFSKPERGLFNLLEIRDSQNLAKLGLDGKPSLLVL